ATCESGVCKCGGATCTGSQVCCSGTCQATCTSSNPDMAMMSNLPLCDCRGLHDPFGSANQCPVSSTCVGNDCCAEDVGGLIPGTCTDTTPCQTSLTPQ